MTQWMLQGLQQQQALPPVSSLSNLNSSGSVPVVALLPHLQNALNHAVMQQVILKLSNIIVKLSFESRAQSLHTKVFFFRMKSSLQPSAKTYANSAIYESKRGINFREDLHACVLPLKVMRVLRVLE